MNNGLVIISYALAAISGICFITGLAVLSGGKVKQKGTTYGEF